MGFMILMNLLFAFVAWTIWRYLKTSFELLDLLRDRAPEVWESLGRPERASMSDGDMDGNLQTIRPLGPWLSWVWSTPARGTLPASVARLHGQVRTNLRLGLAGFAGFVLLFLMLLPEG